MLAEVTTIDGKVISRSKDVERFARFPELYNVRVANGTHVFKWVELGGQKYHCSTRPAATTTAPTTSTTLEADVMPVVTYEGFTFYTSDKRALYPRPTPYRSTRTGCVPRAN